MNEEVQPAALSGGFVGVNSEEVRDNINTLLAGVTGRPYISPYMALQRAAKVLAYFHIVIPQYTFTEGEHGMTTFPIDQFGLKVGMNDQGEMVKKSDDNCYVYFEWTQNNQGMFETFCEVVTQDELDEIMDDIENEEEDEEVSSTDMMGKYHTINMTRMKSTDLREDARSEFVGKEMHKFKHGQLYSGSKKGPTVTDRKQAIAIALSSAKKKGLEEDSVDDLQKSFSDSISKGVDNLRKAGDNAGKNLAKAFVNAPGRTSKTDPIIRNMSSDGAGRGAGMNPLKPGQKDPAMGTLNELNTKPNGILARAATAAKARGENAANNGKGQLGYALTQQGERIQDYLDKKREKQKRRSELRGISSGKRAKMRNEETVNEISAEKLSKYLDKVNTLNRSELRARGNKPSRAVGKIFAKYSKNPQHARVAATEETKAPFEGGKEKRTPKPEGRVRQLAKLAAKNVKKQIIKKKV